MSPPQASPPLTVRGRFIAAAMVGAYAVLNALLVIFDPLIGSATAVIVPPMVLAMIYAVIPFARRVAAIRSGSSFIVCRSAFGLRQPPA